ncbi:MAG: hypothetical protein H8D24_05530 [Gammaproteobacteria bacterium]|uniref:DUF2232 domain-containing protein n=1 Tax=Candidatus Thiopontia autotrophica TaxID=2841688 RepID=A0A8J6NY31_9GAMM|nr:hypothetical protein [Candidatus Thiopontia autotrophica]MBL6968757.1 hypothetical protein [Gammaproteobacteria bacterium]
MRALAEFVLRSRLHAMGTIAMLAFVTLLLPPIGYLTGAVVGLVTLRQGAVEGLLTLAGGLVLAMAVNSLNGDNAVTVGVLALFWLPVWVLAAVLKGTNSLKIVFQIAALFGVVVLFLFYMFVDGNPAIWWQETVQNLFEATGERAVAPDVEILLKPQLAEVLTGVLAAGFFLGLTAMLLIARGWQAMLYNPGGLKQEFLALQLGKNSVLLGLAVMLPGMLMGDAVPSIVPDLMQIWMTLFMVQGLAVAHALLEMRTKRKGWITALYLLTLFTPLGFVVTMVGVTDTWVNYRKQFAA